MVWYYPWHCEYQKCLYNQVKCHCSIYVITKDAADTGLWFDTVPLFPIINMCNVNYTNVLLLYLKQGD